MSVSTRLPAERAAELTDAAERRGETRTELLRGIVEEFLEKERTE